MPQFATKRLSKQRDAVAPDGSDVRILLGLGRGGMAHFTLPRGQISTAVTHRTVEPYGLAGWWSQWYLVR